MIIPRPILISIAATVILFGLSAATLQQWRERPPRWIGKSQRSLTELQGCLGSNWAASQGTKYVAMPIERGMSYTNTGNMRRDILVDVVDEGDHRTVKLWLRSFMGITKGANEQIDKLSVCVTPNV